MVWIKVLIVKVVLGWSGRAVQGQYIRPTLNVPEISADNALSGAWRPDLDITPPWAERC
jgi:hypothetical protein